MALPSFRARIGHRADGAPANDQPAASARRRRPRPADHDRHGVPRDHLHRAKRREGLNAVFDVCAEDKDAVAQSALDMLDARVGVLDRPRHAHD